jgi:hypothetical protein
LGDSADNASGNLAAGDDFSKKPECVIFLKGCAARAAAARLAPPALSTDGRRLAPEGLEQSPIKMNYRPCERSEAIHVSANPSSTD